MTKRTYILVIVGLLGLNLAQAQFQISRQVIGSYGKESKKGNFIISSTVGEAVIQTLFSTQNIMLTQGFHQPFVKIGDLVTLEQSNESCRGSKNGSVFINDVKGCSGPYTLVILSTVDSAVYEADRLPQGSYYVRIHGFGNNGNPCYNDIVLTIGLDSTEDCLLKFYSGITPNDDGDNDTWKIDNIEDYPDNDVKIFNRWGAMVWNSTGYDNYNVVWSGNSNSGDELADATYFYMVKILDIKYTGWVEISR